jgi:3-oxoacyl-[acyl-carrier-protein] synthase-3
MIEGGAIRFALIVSGEDGGPLVEETLAWLSRGEAVTRRDLKAAFSSLTIGSGAVAAVLQRADDPAIPGPRLLGATARSATEFNHLCSGDRSDGSSGPLMETDSEALLQAGIDLAEETFAAFTAEHALTPDSIDRVITHQVGSAHRKLLFERLGLDLAKDYSTFPELGNVGSVSMPITLAKAVESDFIDPGHQVALLGIGSGLACQMLHVRW